MEPSDWSESEGPKSRVKHRSKCRDRRRQSNHCCSKLSHGKTGKSKFTGLSSHSDSDSDTESKVQWPNDNLGPRYNNFGKAEVKFRQLDLRLLLAGELNIVCQGGVSEMEKEARLRLLGDIVFYSAHYQWPALLKFHAAVLSEVEEGAPGWGYDYSRLEQQMLMPFPLAKNKGERKVERVNRPASAANGGGKPDERVVYCGEFQNGSCTLQDNHGGKFFGQSVVFQHICATCWKESKTRAHHPASSTECPLYEHWLLESGPGWEGPVMTDRDGVWCCIENGEMRDVGGLIDLHEKVKSTGLPNFQLAKIPIRSRWNIEYMQSQLAGYQDQKVVTFCKYGWPIGITDGKNLERESVRNHSGAREFPDQMSKYITYVCYVLTYMFGMLFLLLTTSLGCFCPRILLFE